MEEMFAQHFECRGHKQMEKYTVFMDWKNQHCQNDYTTQSNI